MTDAAASAAPDAAGAQSEATAVSEAPSFSGSKHRIKVNGQEREVSYEDLLAGYQLREASDAKFREAKKLAEEAGLTKKELAEFTKDPWSFARKNGLNPFELAENLLLSKMEYESLSDDAKARLKAEREMAKYKGELEERTAKERAAAEAAQAEHAVAEIDSEIGEALKALGRKPTPRLIARIAETMLAHLDSRDGERPKASDILRKVDSEYLTDLQEYFEHLPAERLSEALPQKVRDAIRRADVDRVKSQDPVGSRRQAQQDRPRQKAQRMGTDDFFKKLDKRFGA